MTGRGALVAALASLVLVASCASPSDQELRFVDGVRNRYPRMSVSLVGDDELLAAARSTCDGESSAALDRLVALGVDRDAFVALAGEQICPVR